MRLPGNSETTGTTSNDVATSIRELQTAYPIKGTDGEFTFESESNLIDRVYKIGGSRRIWADVQAANELDLSAL